MKILFPFLYILFFSAAYAQWVPLDYYSLPGSSPAVQLVSNNSQSTVIKVDIPGFQLNEFYTESKRYTSISLGEETYVTEEGMPEIPYIAKVLAVPDKGNISFEILEKSDIQIINDISVPPARKSNIEGEEENAYSENEDVYNRSNIFPEEIVRIERPAVFRDFRIARVSVFPIRYSPSKKEIYAYSSITIRINYNGARGENERTRSLKPIAPSFHRLYKSFILNYDEELQSRYGGMVTGQDLMLCIMPDNFAGTFQSYADWKNSKGTKIHITKFSEIGASANNPVAVKDHILSAYNNWSVPPTHVLIVGDHGIAPVKYVSYDYTFVNEDYFVELAGDDFFPEMMIGRFTNSTNSKLQSMIMKLINYEKYPDRTDTSWFKRGTVCSNNEFPSQVQTKRFTAQVMLNDGHFFSVDTLMSDGTLSGAGCTVDLEDIINAVNNGRSFLNYRGEGWSDGWGASCYYFSIEKVFTLTNFNMLPFVTSIGCGGAMFDAALYSDCFGEALVELGTLTQYRGACAFIGPTSNTHTTYNNKIDKGIYVGLFQEGMESPGEAMLRGKLYLYNIYGTDPRVEYHYRIYCVLGDPSLQIWKEVPRTIEFNSPDTIPLGYSNILLTVTDSITGLPMPESKVCLSGLDIYLHGTTDSLGKILINVIPEIAGQLNLTVTGKNIYPESKLINVNSDLQNVSPVRNGIVDDIEGNDDGLINPNENCSIKFTLKNWGNQNSNNIFAKLSVPDSIGDFIEIITPDSISYGNLAPGDTSLGPPFLFFIKPECPVGFNIPFILKISSSTSTKEFYQIETVHGCMLNYLNYYIDDDGNILKNYRLDPGETVRIELTIQNYGDDIAESVTGILSSGDQYITILDSTGVFGTILPDSFAVNSTDYFEAKVSENCPVQYYPEFALKLQTQNGLYPYHYIKYFYIPVAVPLLSDPTGPDGFGYYMYSSLDTLWEQSPEYEWFEIRDFGSAVSSNVYYQTVDLPFTFKYYGIDYNKITLSKFGFAAFGTFEIPVSFTVNSPLPFIDSVSNITAVFWDMFISYPLSRLLYYPDTLNHRFVIEWYKVLHSTSQILETFQLILLDPSFYPTASGNGEMLFQYNTAHVMNSSTVGLENNDQNTGLQYLYNNIYDVSANYLEELQAIKITTELPVFVSVKDDNRIIPPESNLLYQNYPNPFNPVTNIQYSVKEISRVVLKIFNILGEEIASLVDEEKDPGTYIVNFDGTNFSSGVYFYSLSVGSYNKVNKMILLK